MSSASVRSYSSELRTEQAAETRRRVLLAAAELFQTRGYHGTSRAAIAQAARVSVDTVQATGAKRDLLLHAFEVTAVGEEVSDPLLSAAPEIAAVREATTVDAFLDAAARWTASANARTGRLLRCIRDAAMSDPEVAAVYGPLEERHRRDVDAMVAMAERLGEPVPADGRRALVDELLYVSAPEGHLHFVGECGWSVERYTSWLIARFRSALADVSA
jgi:AcrR family transcriptional regulator